MSGIFSADAIKVELEATIVQTQSALEAFSQNIDNTAMLDGVQDYVRQLRGTFLLLEEQGAVKVCDEMSLTLGVIGDSDADSGKILATSSQALVVLTRFLELLSLQTKSIPAILLPVINSLRQRRKEKPLLDSHFFDVSIKHPDTTASSNAKNINVEIKRLKKFRHMYQAGLLHLIRGDRASAAIRYMTLALGRVYQTLGETPSSSLWLVSAHAVDALATAKADITPSRKRLFGLLDRHLRQLILTAPESFEKLGSAAILKEFLYIIALNRSSNSDLEELATLYDLPTLSYTEAMLSEQRQVLFSPGKSVLASVSDALKADMIQIKESVDEGARGGQFSARELGGLIAKVADIYIMLGLKSTSNVLKKQVAKLSGWADSAAPSHSELNEIADVVIYAESSLARLLHGQSDSDSEGGNKAFDVQLYEARVVLVDESENGLSSVKRSITAYAESQGDKLHLSNVVDTLHGVRGALTFLGASQAATLVDRCNEFVKTELLERGTLIDLKQLELFADALSSIEFYIEGLITQDQNVDLLKLAVHSLRSLHV